MGRSYRLRKALVYHCQTCCSTKELWHVLCSFSHLQIYHHWKPESCLQACESTKPFHRHCDIFGAKSFGEPTWSLKQILFEALCGSFVSSHFRLAGVDVAILALAADGARHDAYFGDGAYHGKYTFDTFSHRKSVLKRTSVPKWKEWGNLSLQILFIMRTQTSVGHGRQTTRNIETHVLKVSL